MKIAATIASFIVAVPCASAAQTTTCRQNGNITTCNQQSLGSPFTGFDSVKAFGLDAESQRARAEKQEIEQRAQAESARQYASQRAQNLREKVGKLISEGDCAGAEKTALKGGDLDLADRARAYCAKK